MMATMLSSPLGPAHQAGRYDLFGQPSSPIYKHDDLPAEFGDQSFGSSMSLGSSFELNRMIASSSTSSQLSSLSGPTNRCLDDQATIRMPRKSPPRYGQESLGAAMGTVLNSRSPGLAAKMNSSDYMDMSSPPPKQHQATPSRDKEDRLPPGSAMKEDTPVQSTYFSRRSASETANSAAGNSLGRLFGTELSLSNRHHSFQAGMAGNESFGSQASPDKEPPPKRRPSSLPLTQVPLPARPSLRAAGMAPPTGGPSAVSRRPNLLKSMTASQFSEGKPSRRSSLDTNNNVQHRASESLVPTTKSFAAFQPSRRTRQGSSEGTDGREAAQLQRSSCLLPLHPTIVESPSPTTFQNEDFGSYFFDPQSPQMTRPSSQNSSISSKLASNQPSRPRILEKSATLTVVPSMLSVAKNGSSLGKRTNPYAKRPSLSALPNSQLGKQKFGAASTSNSTSSNRMMVPAPRRCQSAIDNSAAFSQGEDDLSMSSIDGGDQSVVLSPSDNRGKSSSGTQRMFPPDFDASGSPIAPSARPRTRPSMLRKPSKDDSSPLGYGSGKRSLAKQSEGLSTMPPCDEVGSSSSPFRSAEGLPGFGASEREGKILPCFNVKDDGLMRINPSTLVEVLSGIYDHQMDSFQIVDCRFGYEYEGGHIMGAVNLSTVERVKQYFLHPEVERKLPIRSQSGKPNSNGEWKKKVLIFHCEFSAKRAPSMALALRQADRALAHDYPNCHYPEVYILQGGYCGFFKEFANACEPKCYVEMDDPKFQDKRSIELNGFRKQFARHRSFTFGDNLNNTSRQPYSDGTLLNNSSLVRPIREEESSFENSASPSAVQADIALNRRRLTKGNIPSRIDTFKGIGLKPALGSAPATTGDLSFGSSFGDSSFECGPSDSPCAAAATNRRPNANLLKPGREIASTMARGSGGSLGRHTFQRAATASHIQLR